MFTIFYFVVFAHLKVPIQGTDIWLGTVHDDPGSSVAAEVERGIFAAFAEFNSLSPTSRCNRSLQLLTPSPSAGSVNTQVDSSISFGIVGFVGCTGNAAVEATAALAQNTGVPLFGPVSGLTALRHPFVPNVFPLRGSQVDEGIAIVQQLRVAQGLQLLALFFEEGYADPFAVEAISQSCKSTGLGLVATVSHNSSGLSDDSFGVNASLSSMLKQAYPFTPDAIVVIARDGITAKLVVAGGHVLRKVVFGILSLLDFSGFFAQLGNTTSRLLLSQVVPFSVDPTNSMFKSKYLAAVTALNASASSSPASMEGYLAGRVVAAVLQQHKCALPISNISVSSEAYLRCCGLPVEELTVGPFVNNSCGQGLRQTWLATYISNGSFQLQPEVTVEFPTGSCGATISQLGPKALVFGQSVVLTGTGPAINGRDIPEGIQAAFAEQNALGGIYGHMLRLVTLDDINLLAPAVDNSKALIAHGVYGLIGYYSTSIVNTVAPLAFLAQIPFVAPYTGTTTIRVPGTSVLNVRAAYTDEVYALVRYATGTRGLTRISLFYQDDAFGMQGYTALVAALAAINLKVLSTGTYATGSSVVAPGFIALMSGALPFIPEAVLVFSGVAAGVPFIRMAQSVFPGSTLYLCPSVVGVGFASNFPTNYTNIIITQVTPLPTDTSYRVTQDYQAAMKKWNPAFQPSLVSFESYINARVAIGALLGVSRNKTLDSASFLPSVNLAGEFLISRLLIGPYSVSCNQGMRQVWYTSIVDGNYASMPNESFSFATSACLSDASVFTTSFLIFGQSAPLSGSSGMIGKAIRSGILAAFAEQNAIGGVSGHRLHLWSIDDLGDAAQAVANTGHLTQREPVALIGYFGSELVDAVMSTVTETPMVGPVSGYGNGSSLLNPSVVNVRARYSDEVNALLNYATSSLGLTRISVFYSGDAFGRDGLLAVSSALEAIGMQLLSNGSCWGECTDVYDGLAAIVNNTRAVLPQAVMVWASSPNTAVRLIAQAKVQWTDFPEIVFLCPSVVGDDFLDQLSSAAVDLSRVFVSQVLPPLTFKSHPLVSRYLTALNTYGLSGYSMLSFEGYVSARLAIAVLQEVSPDSIREPGAFLRALYHGSSLVLDTLSLGPFVKGICNLGLRQVWIAQCTAFGLMNVPGATFGFGSACSSVPKDSLRQPLVFAHVVPPSSEIAEGQSLGIRAAFEDQKSRSASVTFHSVRVTYTPGTSVAQLLRDYDFVSVISSLTDPSAVSLLSSVLSSSQKLSLTIRGPTTPAALSPYSSFSVFLGGTPRDEAFAMVRFAKVVLSGSRISLIYEAVTISLELLTAVKLAVVEYSATLVSSVAYSSPVGNLISIVSASDGSDAILLFGTSSTDIKDIIHAAKSSQPALPVFVFLSLIEPMNVVNGLISMAGVYFTAFLPSPTSGKVQLSIHTRAAIEQLNTSLGKSLTFSAMEGYVAAQLVVQLVGSVQGFPSAVGLKQTLYSSSVFAVDEVRLGPYFDSSCVPDSKDASCECSIGASSVSLLRFISPGVLESVPNGVLSFDTCEVQPTASPPSGSSAGPIGEIVGISITTGVVLTLVCCLGLYSFVRKRRARDAALKLAPKGEVTIAFADVQDSTRLWDVCPGMHDAVDVHNKMVRQLIERHQGYEVKTHADSFMVTFQDADSAVLWALDVQDELLDVSWPDDILRQKSCEVVYSTEARDRDGYPAVLFRGLRVRIGMHTGLPEPEYNSRTNRVDYFGPMVNCAARIHSLGTGGQVLISAETQAKLVCPGEARYRRALKYLGRFSLRGMMHEQDVIQVNSVRLSERKFPDINPDGTVLTEEQQRELEFNEHICLTPQICEECLRPLLCPHCHAPLEKNSVAPFPAPSRPTARVSAAGSVCSARSAATQALGCLSPDLFPRVHSAPPACAPLNDSENALQSSSEQILSSAAVEQSATGVG
eukprot:RCo024790